MDMGGSVRRREIGGRVEWPPHSWAGGKYPHGSPEPPGRTTPLLPVDRTPTKAAARPSLPDRRPPSRAPRTPPQRPRDRVRAAGSRTCTADTLLWGGPQRTRPYGRADAR
ncbi:hypothetical protein GCM10010515_01130 [Streptomyces fructofermentans]|uniref:Uncharacterized protein n=1 Tax=Streptomyces fructofermentans TaxID=152141 RepID=A0A918N5A3_9ACTN|nr:hypothetical protein GCM10010515_01130 [Streptomyces fructofermentans]